MKKLCFLLIVFLFVGCSGSDKQQITQKYYKEIDTGHSYYALNCFTCDGAFTRLVKYNKHSIPVNVEPDTLVAWVQHYGEEGQTISENAYKADIIITCDPHELNDPRLKERHVFPNHDDKVLLTWFRGNRLIVTAVQEDTSNITYPEAYYETP
jgi:uncharacterized protein YcfL